MPPRKLKVAIVHPWMPQYRIEFFAILRELLAKSGVELHVFYGDAPPEWAARKDTIDGAVGSKLRTRFIRVGRRHLIYKDTAPLINEAPYDVVITEQGIRNLETYSILLRGNRIAHRHAFWGHGRTYTERRSALEEYFKTRLTLKSDWFFGYTAGGVEHMIACGYPRQRTTVVQNSMDSQALAKLLRSVDPIELDNFRLEYDVTDKTALYIGGLDAAKRLDFLIASGERVHSTDSAFRLLVVGAGDQSDMMASLARTRSWIKLLGPSTGSLKALALRSAQILTIPGRVGLIAVDSLTSGVPIVTTNSPYHAPEFEYLEDGRTCFVADDTLEDFAQTVLRALNDPSKLESMSSSCLVEARQYTVETMAHNFRDGIIALLEKK